MIDLFGAKETSFRDQIRWVQAWIRAFPGMLFMCSGNHDWWNSIHDVVDVYARGGWLRKTSTITVAVDGSRRIEGDYQFICIPWFGIPQELDATKKVIIVTHCPPSGTDVARTNGRDNGDSGLAGALVGYSVVVLCGHIHAPTQWYARRGQSLFINPGCDFEQRQPNHVVIDLAPNIATYVAGNRAPETIPIFEKEKTLIV